MQLLLDNIVFELQPRGGISKLWAKLIEGCLEDSDLSVKFVESPNARRNLFRKEVEIPAEKLIPDRRLPLRLRRYLPVRGNPAQVFHSSYFRTSADPRHKQVVTIHDLIYEKLGIGFGQSVHLRQKQAALKAADAIICVSENTRQDLLELYPAVSEEIIRVIPNGVGDEFRQLADPPDSLEVSGAEFSARTFLLFVGKRVPYKQFDVALDVIESKQATEAGLTLVAVSAEPSRREIADIERRGLADRVVFLPAPSSTELNKLYNLAFGLIFPSLYEGFGIPPLEAMKAGCPVLASDASSIPEVVADAALLCDPGRATNFVEKLQVLADESRRRELVAAGLARAREFSWSRNCSETIALYRSLA